MDEALALRARKAADDDWPGRIREWRDGLVERVRRVVDERGSRWVESAVRSSMVMDGMGGWMGVCRGE